MKCLVTGGAGFIGSHLVDRLLAKGHKVICVDNFDPYYPRELKKNNLALAVNNKRFTLYEADICNLPRLDGIFRKHKIDTVIHLAAKAGVQPSLKDPLSYERTNVYGTLNVLEAMRKNSVNRLIFASSSSVYGRKNKVPFKETAVCDSPPSPYAATKRAAEILIYTYHNLFGIKATILRFFNAYGPRNRPDMALPKFSAKIINHQPITAYRGTRRDYTYIDDIVSGIVAAINKPFEYKIINLGHHEPVPIRDYIRTLENALGIKAKITVADLPPGEMVETMADISKAKKFLRYNPKTSLEEGVTKFVTWAKNNSDLFKPEAVRTQS